MMNKHSVKRILAASAIAALSVGLMTACSGDAGSGDSADGKVKLTWWHNGTAEPLLTLWKNAAADYTKANPNVTFDVQPIQNEQFNTKIPLALSSDSPPDIYFNQGGGLLATQAQSGQVADLTDLTKDWIDGVGAAANAWASDGVQYGVPYSSHVVGFWYRTDLFKKAGIDAPPTTLAELNEDVAKLKTAGIAPIAVGSKDRWPDAFYYNQFAVRECSTDVLKKSLAAADLSDACFTKAGQDVIDFLKTEPFQEGFNGTPAQQGSGSSAGLVADGKAAMELQGDWDISVMTSLAADKDFAKNIGWFPFPSVDGGAGDPTTALGGGDGFSCTQAHAEACADFLKYLSGADMQKKLVESGAVSIPVNADAAASIKDPIIKSIYDYNAAAGYVQTYFDIALPTAAGQALDDASADLFAGKGSATSVAEAVKAAK